MGAVTVTQFLMLRRIYYKRGKSLIYFTDTFFDLGFFFLNITLFQVEEYAGNAFTIVTAIGMPAYTTISRLTELAEVAKADEAKDAVPLTKINKENNPALSAPKKASGHSYMHEREHHTQCPALPMYHMER